MAQSIHIISFDIPFPANYGGAIDVYHKIRYLHKQGIKIILHCFQYGNRKPSEQLENLCEQVYYYQRNQSFINQFSTLPFNVASRINTDLKQRLLQDDFPIIFEVLHTCYLLNDADLKHRIKFYRHSNIEHNYFNELAKAEKSFLKKIYLKIEAFKLKKFEKQITYANAILSVSETDLVYFKKEYPNTPSYYLPSFNANDDITCKVGKGNYILYHGNLSVSENYQAANWLIENVFSKINYHVVIAGLNPPAFLIEKIKQYKHVKLMQNCTEEQMQQLIADAHIHCLYTQQATGLKLKLVNVLFTGKHIIANTAMLEGTALHQAVCITNTSQEFVQAIVHLFEEDFTETNIETRKALLQPMFNDFKTNTLLKLLN